jgi:hypothetical protein
MFAIGRSEPASCGGLDLWRHSIVWLGRPGYNESRVLPEDHPLSRVVYLLQTRFRFRGAWVIYRGLDEMTAFELKREEVRRKGWTIDHCGRCFRAWRGISERHPWPFDRTPGLPSTRNPDVLLLGDTKGEVIDGIVGALGPLDGLQGLTPVVFAHLAQTGTHLVCRGRTHVDNSDGISIVGPRGLDPEAFVPRELVHAVHEGSDAGWAWSYPMLWRE